MALLGNLLSVLGLASRRSYGYGRGSSSSWSSYGRGYRRAPSSSFFGGSLGRMAMGGAAAYLTRSLMSRRRVY
jgi:hypothetical protein